MWSLRSSSDNKLSRAALHEELDIFAKESLHSEFETLSERLELTLCSLLDQRLKRFEGGGRAMPSPPMNATASGQTNPPSSSVAGFYDSEGRIRSSHLYDSEGRSRPAKVRTDSQRRSSAPQLSWMFRFPKSHVSQQELLPPQTPTSDERKHMRWSAPQGVDAGYEAEFKRTWSEMSADSSHDGNRKSHTGLLMRDEKDSLYTRLDPDESEAMVAVKGKRLLVISDDDEEDKAGSGSGSDSSSGFGSRMDRKASLGSRASEVRARRSRISQFDPLQSASSRQTNMSGDPWRRRLTQRLSGEVFEMPTRPAEVTPLMEVVMNMNFTYLVGFFIVLNAVSMGVQADYMARHWVADAPPMFFYVDVGFCLVFLCELVLRIFVYGLDFFFKMKGWQWNLFDTAMVGFQCTEVIVGAVARQQIHVSVVSNDAAPRTNLMSSSHISADSYVGLLRVSRFLRLIRVVRLVRLMTVFSELRMFIVSLGEAVRSLFWIMVLILMALYIGGLYITQLVTDWKIHNQGGEHVPELEEYFGTLTTSMLTLYETISEGIHWNEVMQPLRQHCSPWMSIVFAMWMAFSLYAMLNVITGVFVESAMRTGNEDKKKLLMYQMTQWFNEADINGTGTISWAEFREALSNPNMERFLKEVDLDPQEAWDLFHLLDTHGDGEIPVDEFVNGCVRVTGLAKAIDLVTLMHMIRVSTQTAKEDMMDVVEMLEHLERCILDCSPPLEKQASFSHSEGEAREHQYPKKKILL